MQGISKYFYESSYVLVLLIIGALILCLLSCGNTSDKGTENGQEDLDQDTEELLATGRSATATTQALLLAEVGQQIANGGTAKAVAYCNVRALPLMDSLSEAKGVRISRMSNRNRNPNNRIVTEEDKRAWTHWVGKESGQGAVDTILYSRAKKPYYYKPIRIMAETCLKCHGSRSSEIELATLERLDELYPDDRAVNYRMGDLRGLWKVSWD